ncbi:MAG: LiaF domain-containing protein [Candidatus Limnocylindrales bacterium]
MGRLFRSLFLLGVVASIASAVAAAVAKGRLPSRGEPDDDELDLVAIFDGLEFTSVASSLKGARLTTWYGGATLDLRAATLDPWGATLTVRAAFGGVRVVVPESWPVKLEMTTVFGGVSDTRAAADDEVTGPQASATIDAPTLRIDGFAVFGGVGITSSAPDLDADEDDEDDDVLSLPVSASV